MLTICFLTSQASTHASLVFTSITAPKQLKLRSPMTHLHPKSHMLNGGANLRMDVMIYVKLHHVLQLRFPTQLCGYRQAALFLSLGLPLPAVPKEMNHNPELITGHNSRINKREFTADEERSSIRKTD